MKAKRFWLCLLALAVVLTAYIGTGLYLREQRKPERAGFKLRDFPFPVDFYRVAAGEFSGLSADFLYLDLAATLGGRATSSTWGKAEWDRVQKGFEVAVGLDPYFEPTFRAIQAFLPMDAKRPREAIALLEEVSAQRFWHWTPTFFIAFDYYFHLRENSTASRYFLEAAQRKDAPSLLATLGARLAVESGNAAMGIDFLRRMMETSKHEDEREIYRQRIAALEGVVVLEQAVARYRADFGRNPPDLWALTLHGYLVKLPKNPYYPQYFYLDGMVNFDPFLEREIEARKQARGARPSPLLPPATM